MTVAQIIPSYLYKEYNDDPDLPAFVGSYNNLAQQYLDWFNTASLPIYTLQSGAMLDWVALGLYGEARPYLPYGSQQSMGPFDTYCYDDLAFNDSAASTTVTLGAIGYFFIGISPIESSVQTDADNYQTTDDTFQRCLTWNLYKGDGRTFSIPWLKRRIKRFLTGVNGTDPGISETYDISVSFGGHRLVNIILLGGSPVEDTRPVYDEGCFGEIIYDLGSPGYTGTRGQILAPAIATGVLQLPFQYRYAVYG